MKQIHPAIAINQLTVTHHNNTILWCINAAIKAGSLVGIIGPNGAGKSTLLKAIIGAIKPFNGTISILGGNARQHALEVAYIPQRQEIDWDFPITVHDVVLMGRYGHIGWFKRPKKIDYEITEQALNQVDMLHAKNRHINELSGGQQQRVFLARALAQQASIYLLDEPFVGIDATTEKMIMRILKRLRNQGKTILIVHHDLQTVADYFDMLLVINVKQIGFGPVEHLYNPAVLQKAYSTQVSM